MSSRRWEAPSSTGGKFWEVEQDGGNVTTRWGRLTAKGSSKTTVFEDEAKAIKFVETTIKKKEKEGYAPKAGKNVAGAPKLKTAALKKPKDEPEKKPKAPAKKTAPKKVVVEKKVEEPEEPEEDGGVPTSYVLPALYNIDTKGKERVHLSWVKDATLTKKHGETKGKHTLADRSFEGKEHWKSQ